MSIFKQVQKNFREFLQILQRQKSQYIIKVVENTCVHEIGRITRTL